MESEDVVGSCVIVEIGETYWTSAKYKVGRNSVKDHHWVFGETERGVGIGFVRH